MDALAPSSGALAPASNSPIPALDGVRGLAILLVLAHNLNPFAYSGSLSVHAGSEVLNVGWVGVQMFFVLSGFLITGILLDSQTSPGYFRSFFGRRFLRIFPLYYGVLVIAFVILPWLGWAPDRLLADRENRIWVWTYLVNWTEPLGAGVAAFPHVWSLAVEEQFYLIWPFVVRRATPQRLLVITLVLAVVALVTRIALLLAGAGEATAYMFTVCRIDALALGAAVAALLRIPRARARIVRERRTIAIATAVVFVIGGVATRGYPRASFEGQTAGYTILAIAFAVLVLLAVLDHERGHGWLGAALASPLLRSFGKYSYAIYLFHQPLNQMVGEPLLDARTPNGVGPVAGIIYIGAVTSASYLLALLSYYGYEKHFLALKRYFPQVRGSRALSAR